MSRIIAHKHKKISLINAIALSVQKLKTIEKNVEGRCKGTK